METSKQVIEIKSSEIRFLEEQLRDKNNLLEGLVNVLPFPLVVYNNNNEITLYNTIFLHLLSFKAKNELVDKVDQNIESILTSEVYNRLQELIGNSSVVLSDKVTFKGSEYLPSYYSICNNTMNVLIFRELSDTQMVKEEILSLLEHVVNSNHSMVKQIGHILGEESTKRTKLLNSIINSIK